ncbi:uncharacterized protein PG998_005933 [Apiospora kogelbergensis]|uniref:uncharacterized protein n=1 Tax=Apiospora kogelbergensis TaxID=1337665 RepID=UPI003130F967
MTSVLGKRKSRRAEKDPAEVAAAQEKLRKFFESQYEPITPTTDSKEGGSTENGEVDDERSDDESGDGEDGEGNSGSDSEDDDEDDEWGGLSGEEDTAATTITQPHIEVVEHSDISIPTSLDPTLRKASRAYLSSRVPNALSDPTSQQPAKQSSKAAKDEDTATLLRDDLALQRLLTESHLFSSTFGAAGAGSNGTEHEGRNRHKATDLRLAALGSKDSIYKQAKMPMAHRKGIIAAAEKREDKRRREARENGIVLERPTTGVHEGWTGLKGKKSKAKASSSSSGRKREAAVDAPAVGKLRNGLLQLSKKDIRDIEGSGGGSRGGKGGGKKRRR